MFREAEESAPLLIRAGKTFRTRAGTIRCERVKTYWTYVIVRDLASKAGIFFTSAGVENGRWISRSAG